MRIRNWYYIIAAAMLCAMLVTSAGATAARLHPPIAGQVPGPSPNPCPAAWQNQLSLPSTILNAGSAVVNGNLYIIGGQDPPYYSTFTSTVRMFDPISNTWTLRAPLLISESLDNAAVIGGKIYVPGGFDPLFDNAMQIYDPVTDSWSRGADLPVPLVGAAVAAVNGKLYIIGGSDFQMVASTVYEYDPATNTYATKAPLPQASEFLPAVVLNNHIYIAGGVTGFAHYVYDPSSDSWSSIAAGLTANFGSPAGFALDGEVWLVGGNDGDVTYPPDQEVQIYNPNTDTWRFGPVLNNPRANPTGALLGESGYIVGGISTQGDYLSSMESIGQGGCGTPTLTATFTPTAAPQPSNTPTPTQTTTASLAPSSTPAAASATPTSTPLASATPANTGTPGRPTYTPAPPTDTPTNTPILPTITPTDCANSFVDITGNVFYTAIHHLDCRSVINGTDAAHYSPGGISTRGQFAKVVVLGFGTPFYTPAGSPDFTDVLPGYFTYQYIESGYHAGILSGFDQASCTAAGQPYPCYLPNRPITRGQLTKLVVNAGGYTLITPTGGHQDFVDVPPSNVFYVSIETAYHNSIVHGYPGGLYLPNNNIRRDEMAQIVFEGISHRLNRP